MSEDPREKEPETESGPETESDEVPPAREAMSLISTDPADALVPVPPPSDELSSRPFEDERDVHRMDPLDPPAA